MQRRYKVVDVFTAKPLKGNPVAVVLDAEGLDDATLQGIARWTNLSETTFFLPATQAGADYRLRIFTPGGELPFAGHPTLGSAHAALEAGLVTARDHRLLQQCGIGLVELKIDPAPGSGHLWLQLPPARAQALGAEDVAELEAALGARVDASATPSAIDVGPVWITARLADAAQVLALEPDMSRLAALTRRLRATGVTVFGTQAPGSESAIEVRSFAPSAGVPEDPVCGSGNGSVAAFQRAHGLLAAGGGAYLATQGRCLGRDGRVSVRVEASGSIWLGGACITCVDGSLSV